MILKPGTHLGPYEIRAPLGGGGMGEVYRAKDTRLEREVAIKILPEHLADDQAALARFEREAKAVAALSHPNILAVYDVGADQGLSFVVMELLEGETEEAREILYALRQPSGQKYVSSVDTAMIYVGLGEKEQAFAWLEEAFDERDVLLVALGSAPIVDPLRDDPRFADLLRRIALEP